MTPVQSQGQCGSDSSSTPQVHFFLVGQRIQFMRQSSEGLVLFHTFFYVNLDLGSEVVSLARAVRLEIWTRYELLVAGSSLFGVWVT